MLWVEVIIVVLLGLALGWVFYEDIERWREGR